MKKKGQKIPAGFKGFLDKKTLSQTQSYTAEKTKAGFFSRVFDDIIFPVFIFSGLLGLYSLWIEKLQIGFVFSGILFFLMLTLIEAIIHIPFDLYQTFKIENKFGFNTMTPKLWWSDFLKSFIIQTVLIGLLIGAGLWIIQASPSFWWLLLWSFFFLFSLFMMFISPYVIEPLFNKFTPIEDKELEQKIKELFSKIGLSVSRVFIIDASKRSKHTNAYFTGIGKVKRIVFYDTLLEKLDHSEILSVLAHEAGHWKKRHVLKTIVATEVISLIVFYTSFSILTSNWLIQIFSIPNNGFFAQVILLGFILGLVSFVFSPLAAIFSRKNEAEADLFAAHLMGETTSLQNALKKLSKDNLSNLFPHPLYAFLHYSHPPLLERLEFLKKL
jgi:STE24 endopeptidase